MYVYALPATGIIADISEYDNAENTLANAASNIEITTAGPAPTISFPPCIAIPIMVKIPVPTTAPIPITIKSNTFNVFFNPEFEPASISSSGFLHFNKLVIKLFCNKVFIIFFYFYTIHFGLTVFLVTV